MIQETTLTHEVEPQDEAMDAFRRLFKLVAGCNVSDDGMVMAYTLNTLSGAVNSIREANRVIKTNDLPLKCVVKALMKGKEVAGMELRIIYNPK